MRVAGRGLGEEMQLVFASALAPTAGKAAAAPGQSRGGQPALSIDLWDEAETGVAWDRDAVELSWRRLGPPRGDLIRVAPDRSAIHFQGQRWRALLLRRAGRLIASVDSVTSLSHQDRCRPFNAPLVAWLFDRGYQVVHAAVVERDGQGVLIAGPENSGKSTVALACVAAGYGFVGDDQVALAVERVAPRAHAVYSLSALDPSQIASFPWLKEAAAPAPPGEGGKTLLRLARVASVPLVGSAAIRVGILPQVGAGPRELLLASPAAALRAIAPTSLLLQPMTAGPTGLDTLASFLQTIPVHRLAGSSELRGIPPLVDRALDQALTR
jgi:hypothetical protein